MDFARVNCISPGFIATDILDIHPLEWREKWLSMIPANRMAQTYELKGVSISETDISRSSTKQNTGIRLLRIRRLIIYDGF